MKKLFVSITIGIIAGVIDVVPMILQDLDLYYNISAFVFWVVMGIVISYSALPVRNWLKGMIIGVLSALPVMIIVFSNDPKSVVPMFVMSIILGSLTGIFTGKFAD